MRFQILSWMFLSWLAAAAVAGAAAPSAPREAPPVGLRLPEEQRAELERGVAELGREIQELRPLLRQRPALAGLEPDVEIFRKAVQFALRLDEFYRTNDVAIARRLLADGIARARELRAGRAPWLTATGLVVRGYVSKLDGSVQPYGLIVPPTWEPGAPRRHRLDVWLHGRDDRLTELKFLGDRQRSYGEFAPSDTFVLHPYGRFCNAFKFAGEMDVLEAMAHVATHYPIDEHRRAVRGFSMGGAGCWHLAVHYPGVWRAAAPGAGFAETAEYTGILAKSPAPPDFEQRLWHLYDAADYALNLFQCPTIAYSGELDKQRQAAEVMARAMQAEGLELRHLIGPGVQHAYEPQTKRALAQQFDELMARGREPWPAQVRWTSWTLRYNQLEWVTVDRLQRHWERARVEARVEPRRSDAKGPRVVVGSTNVAALRLNLADAPNSMKQAGPVQVVLDGQPFSYPGWTEAASAAGRGYELKRRHWTERSAREMDSGFPPPKAHGLQGPVDDAFLDRFLFVRPTGRPLQSATGDWTQTEMTRARDEWRAQFRGEVRITDDTAITAEDIRDSHLILWGDPQSNQLLGRICSQLPLRWDGRQVRLAGKKFEANGHVPVLVYPNPLNPGRYVVLNSGFTFWEFRRASNALQTPKLPDFAVRRLGEESNRGIIYAGFFGEHWEVLP
ncbi:MAG TPA: prolyl oligopeptidase family serine peptidase [Candidatus Saccharimonadales bacterium]|nr:prolyl oligopeptidase family serine peptidase [Candidatus Saccharimonadales bacterium]